MKLDVKHYHDKLGPTDREICELLFKEINQNLSQAVNKVWHGAPVWFLNGNPIVGYSKQKAGLRLMFWSGTSFNEPSLQPSASGKFKDASIFYHSVSEVNLTDLHRWLEKAKTIQWDYKNIVKRKGYLKRLS